MAGASLRVWPGIEIVDVSTDITYAYPLIDNHLSSLYFSAPKERSTTLYGSGAWSQSGGSGFDGAKINDGIFDVTCLVTANGSTLTLDAGVGINLREFLFYFTGAWPGVNIDDSDNGSSWTPAVLSPSEDSFDNGGGVTGQTVGWTSAAGNHRYWRITFLGATTLNEVQPQTFTTTYAYVREFRVYDMRFGKKLYDTIPIAAIPTSAQPYNCDPIVTKVPVNGLRQDLAGLRRASTSFDCLITMVAEGGTESVGVRITATTTGAAGGSVATLGGRILVGPTCKLAVDIGTGATTITVDNNQMVNGDRVYLESAPGGVQQIEFMAITSSATANGSNWNYTVTRNLDASGADSWKAGDAVFNTGQTGNGFIDIYSVRGTKASSEIGPTVVGNIRNSSTYNDWTPRFAIGNLNGLYGYATDIYGVALGVPTGAWVKIDPTNGVRIGFNATTNVQIDAGGGASFTGSITAASGTIGGWTIGATELVAPSGVAIRSGQSAYDTGTGFFLGNVSGTPKFSIGDGGSNKLTWNGSVLHVTGLFCDSGITFTANGYTIGTSTKTLSFDASGLHASSDLYLGGSGLIPSVTATTVGAAGGAAALPATPTGYWQIVVGGTVYKVPYYNS